MDPPLSRAVGIRNQSLTRTQQLAGGQIPDTDFARRREDREPAIVLGRTIAETGRATVRGQEPGRVARQNLIVNAGVLIVLQHADRRGAPAAEAAPVARSMTVKVV